MATKKLSISVEANIVDNAIPTLNKINTEALKVTKNIQSLLETTQQAASSKQLGLDTKIQELSNLFRSSQKALSDLEKIQVTLKNVRPIPQDIKGLFTPNVTGAFNPLVAQNELKKAIVETQKVIQATSSANETQRNKEIASLREYKNSLSDIQKIENLRKRLLQDLGRLPIAPSISGVVTQGNTNKFLENVQGLPKKQEALQAALAQQYARDTASFVPPGLKALETRRAEDTKFLTNYFKTLEAETQKKFKNLREVFFKEQQEFAKIPSIPVTKLLGIEEAGKSAQESLSAFSSLITSQKVLEDKRLTDLQNHNRKIVEEIRAYSAKIKAAYLNIKIPRLEDGSINTSIASAAANPFRRENILLHSTLGTSDVISPTGRQIPNPQNVTFPVNNISNVQRELSQEEALRRTSAASIEGITLRRNIAIENLERQHQETLSALQTRYNNARTTTARNTIAQEANTLLTSSEARLRTIHADASANLTAARAEASRTSGLLTQGRALEENTRQHQHILVRIFDFVAGYRLINSALNTTISALLSVPKIGIELENTRAVFQAVFVTTKSVNEQFAFLDDLADKTGARLASLRNEFKDFAASAIFSNETLGKTKDIFANITEVGTVLHLPEDRLKSAFVAINQMYAKNQVMSEELKKQLGNQLPAAVAIFARSLNIPTAELYKQLKAGLVKPTETIAGFAELYKQIFASKDAFDIAAQGLNANLGRLQNAWTRLATDIYKNISGGITFSVKTATNALDTLRENLDLIAISGATVGTVLGISLVKHIYTYARGLLFAAEATRVYTLATVGMTAAQRTAQLSIEGSVVAQAAMARALAIQAASGRTFLETITLLGSRAISLVSNLHPLTKAITLVAGAIYLLKDATINYRDTTISTTDIVQQRWIDLQKALPKISLTPTAFIPASLEKELTKINDFAQNKIVLPTLEIAVKFALDISGTGENLKKRLSEEKKAAEDAVRQENINLEAKKALFKETTAIEQEGLPDKAISRSLDLVSKIGQTNIAAISNDAKRQLKLLDLEKQRIDNRVKTGQISELENIQRQLEIAKLREQIELRRLDREEQILRKVEEQNAQYLKLTEANSEENKLLEIKRDTIAKITAITSQLGTQTFTNETGATLDRKIALEFPTRDDAKSREGTKLIEEILKNREEVNRFLAKTDKKPLSLNENTFIVFEDEIKKATEELNKQTDAVEKQNRRALEITSGFANLNGVIAETKAAFEFFKSGFNFNAINPATQTTDISTQVSEDLATSLTSNITSSLKPINASIDRWDQLILENSKKYNINPELVKQVIRQESGGNPNAISFAGASAGQGLGQISDILNKDLRIRDRLNPAQNIEGTVRQLSILLDKFKYYKPEEQVKFALAAYNAGLHSVTKSGKPVIPNSPETKDYVKDIFAAFKETQTSEQFLAVQPKSSVESKNISNQFSTNTQLQQIEATREDVQAIYQATAEEAKNNRDFVIAQTQKNINLQNLDVQNTRGLISAAQYAAEKFEIDKKEEKLSLQLLLNNAQKGIKGKAGLPDVAPIPELIAPIQERLKNLEVEKRLAIDTAKIQTENNVRDTLSINLLGRKTQLQNEIKNGRISEEEASRRQKAIDEEEAKALTAINNIIAVKREQIIDLSLSGEAKQKVENEITQLENEKIKLEFEPTVSNKAILSAQKQFTKLKLDIESKFSQVPGQFSPDVARQVATLEYENQLDIINLRLKTANEEEKKALELLKEKIGILTEISVKQQELANQERLNNIATEAYNNAIARTSIDRNRGNITNFEEIFINARKAREVLPQQEASLQNRISVVQQQPELYPGERENKIEKMRLDFENLKTTAAGVSAFFKTNVAQSFTSAFTDFVNGNKSAIESMKDFAVAFITMIQQIIIEKLALAAVEKATSAIGSLFSSGGSIATQTSQPIPSNLSSQIHLASGGNVIPFRASAIQKVKAGRLSGPGTETSDSIATVVPIGSYIIKAASAKKAGFHNLEKLLDKKNMARVNLSNNEFLVPPEIVKSRGIEFFDHINKTGEINLASGGPVGDIARQTLGNNVQYITNTYQIAVNHTGKESPEDLGNTIALAIMQKIAKQESSKQIYLYDKNQKSMNKRAIK